MKNNPYSLQLLHGSRLFDTREEAFEYINGKFKGKALWGEPAVFFYGSGNDVKMVVAVGRDENGNICTLDSNDLDVSVSMEDFQSALNAAGLYLDENKITDRVEYRPDLSDDLLRDTHSLAEAIDKISKYAQQIDSMSIDDVKIFGNESDTANTTATRVDDSWVINTDVRLSRDRSIIVSDGGLSANISVDVNEATNAITVTIGDVSKTYTLPGVNIIDHAEYDAEHKSIVIYLKGENAQDPIVIPVGDIVETWVIENPPTSPVELHKHATQNEDKIYATLKLRSTDNVIGVDQVNGEMYVSREEIKNIAISELPDYSGDIASLSERITEVEGDVDSIDSRVAANTNSISVLRTDVDRNASDIQSLNTTLSAVSAKATQNEANITVLTQQTNRNTSEIERVETKLDNEIATARERESILTESVTTAQNAIASEVSRAQAAESTLSERITNAVTEISSVSSNVDEKIENAMAIERALREGKDELLETKIDNLESSVETGLTTTLNSSKAYTDTKVDSLKNEVESEILETKTEILTTAQGYATTAETNSKAYTDEKVTAERERAQAVENQHTSAIAALQTAVDGKVSSVELRQNESNPLVYSLYVDGSEIGQINIPKDQFLKTASYNPSTKTIELVCVTTEGEVPMSINVADLVDEYLAGDGLKLTGNVFSIKINEDSEAYLTIGENGIKLSGIDAALAEKANADEVYSKTEADNKFVTDVDLSGYATDADLANVTNTLSTVMSTLETFDEEIDIINGNEAQEGSILNALKEAKDYTDTKTQTEQTRAEAAESEINSKLDIINGNEATEGSIKKSLKDAKDYADAIVSQEAGYRANEVSRLENLIAGKASADSVYTKAEIDAKGYLTSANLEPYATKSELANEVSALESVDSAQNARLTAIETVNTQQDTRLTNLEAEATRLNLIAEDTNSVDINVSKANNGTTVKADVRLDSTVDNILRISGNGLYANVDLTYNAATNTLTLNNGASTRNIQLSDHTLVNNGYYDSENKQIVLVVTANGETTTIGIPVSDLVNQLIVDNGDNNPINLHLVTNDQGVNVLSARLDISNAANNAILNNNGTLFASKEAQHMTALWNGDTITIQKAIDNLKESAELIADLDSDVADLVQDVADVKSDLQSLDGDVTNLTNRVAALETSVGNITTIIGNYNVQLGTIADRLAALEQFMNRDMIDFNDRNANEVDDDTIIVDGQAW